MIDTEIQNDKESCWRDRKTERQRGRGTERQKNRKTRKTERQNGKHFDSCATKQVPNF